MQEKYHPQEIEAEAQQYWRNTDAFKALELRPKDQQDFEAMLPQLTPLQQAALRSAISQIDAAHPWLKELPRPQ